MKKNITIYKNLTACFANKQLIAFVVSIFLITNSQQILGQAKIVSKPVTAVSLLTVNKDSAAAKNFASIGDFVWIDNNINGIQDAGEPGLPNVEVVLYDSLLNIIDTRYTNDSGYYHFNNIAIPTDGSKTFLVGFNNIPPNYAYTKISS